MHVLCQKGADGDATGQGQQIQRVILLRVRSGEFAKGFIYVFILDMAYKYVKTKFSLGGFNLVPSDPRAGKKTRKPQPR